MKKRQIGIFGGSFNPIHVGHIGLAKTLLKEARLDEIWFVVSPQNPLKEKTDLLDDDKRLEMVRQALQGETCLKACDFEFHLPKPSYMLYTLQKMSQVYPECNFTLLIGGDNWNVFDQWKGYHDIINHYHIVIYPRENSFIDEAQLPPTVQIVNTPLLNISSTDIRKNIHQGKSIRGMVPEQIEYLATTYYKK